MYNSNSGGGPGGGGAWTPGMGMPPVGFGVVAQQPGGNRMMVARQQMPPQAQHMASWQQQQFMAAQMGMASGGAVGVQPLPQQQQQQGFHQFQQPPSQQVYPPQPYQQQQWLEAQKKAVEEQRKLYDQMMKQRQFDEQKMRLKAFSNTKKSGVSADTMIENILGTKDMPKPKSPLAPKKEAGSEVKASASNSSSTSAKQGTSVDWSKMNDIGTLFTPKQSAPVQPAPSSSNPQIAPENVSHEAPMDQSASGVMPHIVGSNVPQGHNQQGNVVTGNGNGAVPSKKLPVKSIPLPPWLSNTTSIPPVYKHATSLVEGKDGWVDTSRAYMLLMKTGLPPPFLGVLWEMVNRTQPGQLLEQEFITLLALIALVQTGQAITTPDVLGATTEPVLPVIDHPALLPLVQDYIKQRQQMQLQQQNDVDAGNESQQITEVNEDNDEDEFADFVSGPTAVPNALDMNTSPNVGQVPSTTLAATTGFSTPLQPLAPTPASTSLQVDNKPLPSSVDKMKRMNLPEVGYSPELSPSTSFDHAHDDEFDDFQSASMANASEVTSSVAPPSSSPPASTAQIAETSNNSNFVANFSSSSSSQDRYAVFRELESTVDESSIGNGNSSSLENGNNDDSFGDFCSVSEPASLSMGSATFPPLTTNTAGSGTSNTTPVSFEVFSTPPEAPESSVDAQFEADFGVFNSAPSQQPSNYADIHEAMKRVEEEQRQKTADNWADPFGEFEEAGRPSVTVAQPVPRLNVGRSIDEDDDFGDFMGPDSGMAEPDSLSLNHPFPKLSEPLGETQSVASLELPGLEMTVGLQASESRGSGSGQSPDLFMQTRTEIGGVEDQLRSLALGSSDVSTGGGGGNSPSGNGSNGVPSSTNPNTVLESFTSGLMDKYSIIREEASKTNYDEAHTGSWQRCLEGSVKLLEQGHNILGKLTDKKLKAEVLSTSQMQDYLANLQEVWLVCERISKSSQCVTTTAKVDQLLSQAKTLWDGLLLDSDNVLSKVELIEGENQMGSGEVCGVCLATGGSKLSYGGHSYHPPCANLWLNCVDLLLPSLTPVTLL